MLSRATSVFRRVGGYRAHSSCCIHGKTEPLVGTSSTTLGQDDNEDLKDLFEKNQTFIQKKNSEFPDYFKRTRFIQSPKFVYIGCSDARVQPNEIMGLHQDEVFVTRNIGNQVAAGDMNVHSVLEFSLGVLKVPNVLVVGHTECGAIKGALSTSEEGGFGFLEHWLRHVRDVARIHLNELKNIQDPDELHRRMVEVNVQEQCINVLKTPIVQKMKPNVYGMIYDVHTGKLTQVPYTYEFQQLYKLF